MSHADEMESCEWCGEPVEERAATGPRGEPYCSDACAKNAGVLEAGA